MNSWVLTVARDGAKIYNRGSAPDSLVLVAEFQKPEGRLLNKEFSSDKPGRSMESGASSKHSVEKKVKPRDHFLQVFLKSLGNALDNAFQKNQFEELVLVAEPHMLGLLRKSLGKRVLARVNKSITKNLLHAPEREIIASI